MLICGGGEIRTHGPLTEAPVFKTGAFDHSATPPCVECCHDNKKTYRCNLFDIVYNEIMRYLGIDFGSKRIGIAVSDEDGKLAFPNEVVKNSEESLSIISKICRERKIEKVVIGESLNYKGEDNPIMKKIVDFKLSLENELHIPVVFEPEMMTSVQAERFQGKNDKIDASAAAIILQSYLDREIKN